MKAVLALVAAVCLVPLLVLALVISSPTSPARSGTPGVVCNASGVPAQQVADNSPQQIDVAGQIVAAGQELGLPQEAWVIAVATAITESDLRPLPYGDAVGPDSRGVFQQRDSWGPPAIRLDPKGAAKLFYQRLIALDPPWDSTPLSRRDGMNPAQRVQRSAFPQRYADKEQQARQIVGAVLKIPCPQPGGDAATTTNPRANDVVQRALAQQGVPYSWAGGGESGPTAGKPPDQGVVGFDCSGLAQYAWAAVGVHVPRQTRAIWDQLQGSRVDKNQLQPGDLLLLSADGTPNGIHHVGLYVGGNAVVEAPESGQTVRVLHDIWTPASQRKDGTVSLYATREFFAAVRPGVSALGS